MDVLFVADALPMPDRNSADFRLARLLGLLAARTPTGYVALGQARQAERIGAAATEAYRADLGRLGVQVHAGGVAQALAARRYDAVVFEWHFPALALLDEVRYRQPQARVVIDSVDVVYNRLEAKARVTGTAEDRQRAADTRARELAAYAAADLVITVTDADADILRRALPALPTLTIPNIHPLQEPVADTPDAEGRLLFIGSYARPGGETNIDAMRWFCADILPRIVARLPQTRLRIVGGPRCAEIDALAGPHVEVLGYVAQTQPYLQSSAVSIAPLRFGGGMKGKIGEAMSYALPVVTTPTGIEGFGLEPGTHALVADTPHGFAEHVTALLLDGPRRRALGLAGYGFIRQHYSDHAAAQRIDDLLHRLPGLPVARLPVGRRLARQWRDVWERNLGWRLANRAR
jgi:glycosyltransferase involved in cell wall biosynthesis